MLEEFEIAFVSDKVGPKYPDVPTPTKVDELVVAKLRKLGIIPSEQCSDTEFLRLVLASPVAPFLGHRFYNAWLKEFPFALDYGVWTANADRVSQNMKTTYKAPGFNGSYEIWITGTASPRAKQELRARGFTVVEEAGSRFDIFD